MNIKRAEADAIISKRAKRGTSSRQYRRRREKRAKNQGAEENDGSRRDNMGGGCKGVQRRSRGVQ